MPPSPRMVTICALLVFSVVLEYIWNLQPLESFDGWTLAHNVDKTWLYIVTKLRSVYQPCH